jgi:glycosyltransferase involved in cell wall biosynthesis
MELYCKEAYRSYCDARVVEIMLKILLIANFIHRPGGAGRLEAYLAKAISQLGHKCVLIARTRPHKINEQIMKGGKNIELYIISKPDASSRKIGILSHLKSLVMRYKVSELIFREKPDVIISSGGVPKHLVNAARSIKSKVLVYYHMIAPWYVEIRGFYRKYKWSDLSMLYFGFSIALGKVLSADFSPLEYVDGVIVNSLYMAHIAKRYWGIMPYILQPPIEINNYVSLPRENRFPQIVSIGRLDPDKHYEDIIEAVGKNNILRKNVKVWLLGFMSNSQYLLSIIRLAKKYNVKLIIEANVSEERKRKVLSNSMIFINASRHEHFGINVVEAMASGTPVIVHKSGGPYYDIIDRGTYGLSYSAIEELQSNIEILIEEPNTWNRYSQLSIMRAKQYDFESFKQRLANILDKVI